MDPNALNFLRDSLTHHYNVRNALDSKASFLLAISGVIFGLSVVRLEKIQFVVIAVAAFLTISLAVFGIFLPFRGKVKEKWGLMCWWGFLHKSFESYKAELDKILLSEEEIKNEYQREIWLLAQSSLKPKTALLKAASTVLLVGLLAGFILFFI